MVYGIVPVNWLYSKPNAYMLSRYVILRGMMPDIGKCNSPETPQSFSFPVKLLFCCWTVLFLAPHPRSDYKTGLSTLRRVDSENNLV